ncbi:MAG: DMT family transporter [Candidatus Marsarchaeota archaeon]|nr:DMT family transporter [Candidatus Marsarchaeota archaeon]
MERDYLYVLLAILIWSTQAFVTKLLVTSLSPVIVYFFSSLLAGATLLILYFLLNKGASARRIFKKPGKILIISVLLGASNLLLFTSFSMLQASSVVITLYVYPILMAIFNSLLFTKKFETRELVGVLFGFLGIFIFATGGSLTTLHIESSYGYLMVLGGAVAWALYLIVQKHFGLEVVSSNGLAFLISALFALPLLTLINLSGIYSISNPQILVMLLYFSVMTFGIANILYLNGLRKVRVINGALGSYLTPVIAVILNYLVLGELIFWYDIVPILFVFIGFLVINWNAVSAALPKLRGHGPSFGQ